MITTEEARRKIFAAIRRFPSESVRLEDSVGRILHQNVVAERDQPPFDRVTMDGIAIACAALDDGQRRFRIAGTQHAGDAVRALDDPETCLEVMTGTVMPPGADTVVPVERIEVSDGHARIEAGYRPEKGQFVHRRGSDHVQGTEVLEAGAAIAPVDVAILASCGLQQVQVARAPVVRIISTGNELVPAGAAIAPHQIRLSNGPALAAMLSSQGYTRSRHDHLADDPAELEARIGEHLESADVLILSGGVSMGKADFVPQVLSRLGVDVVLHKISQRPGKPMWFGIGPSGQAVFALPGNPVSSLVCCRQYVLPALFHASGRREPLPVTAILDEAVRFSPTLTCFLPVKLRPDDKGALHALPVPTNTSGDFTALGGTDGYVELERDTDDFPAGAVVPFHAWESP
jgi:molybdopterin molybdotransferase